MYNIAHFSCLLQYRHYKFKGRIHLLDLFTYTCTLLHLRDTPWHS
jgi:hypothetical protein